MTEDKKTQQNAWQHDQQVNFKNMTPHLEKLREALQIQINSEKSKLAQMVGARDSIKRR